MLNPSGNSPTQRLGVQVFQELIRNRPLAFWGGLWASLVVVAYVAALGLLNPGTVEWEKQPEATPKIVDDSPTGLLDATVEESQTALPTSTGFQDSQTSQGGFRKVDASAPEPGMPMWLFSAVALTCATGSWLIYGSMRHSSSQRRKSLRRETSLKASSTTAIRKKRQPSSRTNSLKKQRSRLEPPISVADAPLVTVLPPEKSHPLDWGEDSLADMMDLRKRQSLEALLRDR